jgi:hypothetical protein
MFTGGVDDPTEEDDPQLVMRTDGWSWEPEGEDREGAAVRRFRVRVAMQSMVDQIHRDYQAERDRMYGVPPKPRPS